MDVKGACSIDDGTSSRPAAQGGDTARAASTALGLAGPLRSGVVLRLNRAVGFGYVGDDDGVHSYFFLAGKALTHSRFEQLSTGQPVRFRVSGQGQVDELVPA